MDPETIAVIRDIVLIVTLGFLLLLVLGSAILGLKIYNRVKAILAKVDSAANFAQEITRSISEDLVKPMAGRRSRLANLGSILSMVFGRR